jgi:hypothetical protein
VLAACQVPQAGVVLGLFREDVVVGEDEPSLAGRQQFAVVSGKAPGDAERPRTPRPLMRVPCAWAASSTTSGIPAPARTCAAGVTAAG